MQGKKELNPAQRAALTAMTTKRDEFFKQYQPNLGDELEEHIRTFIDQPPFNQALEKYDGPELLRINILEIVMAPLIQLTEIGNFGVAAVFAERIIALDKKISFEEIFYGQISKLSPHEADLDEDSSVFNLKISIAKLVNIFTFNYSLFELHSIKTTQDLIDTKRQEKLRQEMADLAVAYVAKILDYFKEVAQNKNLNLEELKQQFLANEKSATPNQRWLKVMENRGQIESDAMIARDHFIESLYVIESNIRDLLALLGTRSIDESELEKWIDRGLLIVTNPNYLSLLAESRNHQSFYRENNRLMEKLDPRVKNKLIRYDQIRKKDIPLTVQLNTLGCPFQIDEIMSLSNKSREFLLKIRDGRDPLQDYKTAIIKDCTLTMLEHFEKIVRLKISLPAMDVRELRTWPKDRLEPLLDTLISQTQRLLYASTVLRIDINIIMTWPQQPLEMRMDFLLHGTVKGSRVAMDQSFVENIVQRKVPAVVFSFIFNSKIAPRLLELILILPPALQSSFLLGKMTMEGMRTIEKIARQDKAMAHGVGACILNHPYFVKRLGLNLPCHKEIDFIVANKVTVGMIRVVYSDNGIACVQKKYCDWETQFKMPVESVPTVQEILLELKRPCDPQFLMVLADSRVIAAYKAKFIDTFFMEGSNASDLKKIANYWQAAKNSGIHSAFDTAFSSFITKYPSPIKANTIWAKPVDERNSEGQNPLTNQRR